jgi:hypothetical protein
MPSVGLSFAPLTLLGHALLRVGLPVCIREKLGLLLKLNPLPFLGSLLAFLFCCELAVRDAIPPC